MTRLSLQVFYLWRHVSSTAPPLIFRWSNLEILFGPLHRSSPFIGELHCQAIQTEQCLYIVERTQKAVYIVRCLWLVPAENTMPGRFLKIRIHFLHYWQTYACKSMDNRKKWRGSTDLYKRGHGVMLNPNPHCFIVITKAAACGWKDPLLPHPLHSPVRGKGKGGDSSMALKICLIKTWVTLKLSSKAYWKWHFYGKRLKLKSLFRYFARHFLF
jgi:hypothetical protein